VAQTTEHIDAECLDRLLGLRLVVGRFGELDNAGWWNSKGQLGRLGATTLRRGFPRTYRFAQARSVFAIARHRCGEVFDPPGCFTLWRLPEQIEEQFDARWEAWIERVAELAPIFEGIEDFRGQDLPTALRAMGLVDDVALSAASKLKASAEGRAVPLPGTFAPNLQTISLLALGFSKGAQGALAVPYVRSAG
jgi:hypothetical protein